MELLMLFAAVLCLALLLQCSTSARAPATTLRQPTIKIRDPAVARRELVDHADAFSNRPSALFPVALVTGRRRRWSDNIMSVPYGPHWRRLRCNIFAEILHPAHFGFLAALQREAIQAMVTDLSARGARAVVVVRDSLYTAMFALVARLCFGDGVDERRVRAMQRVMRNFLLAVGDVRPYAGSMLDKLVQWRRRRRFLAFREQQAELFLPLITARRHSRHCNGGVLPYVDSLLDLRVPNVDDDSRKDVDARRALTDDEMVSLVSEFLGAGTEPVVSCIEWTLGHLVNQPELQNKLRREVDDEGEVAVSDGAEHLRGMLLLRAVVLESLRLHPPVPVAMREVRTEGQVVGCATMPASGIRVHFTLGAVGRNKEAWTEPDEFRPERFLPGGEGEGVGPLPGPKEIRMMPFGAGRRYCPGMGLAMLQITLSVAALVREFEWSLPAEDGNVVELTELNGFFKRMKKPLRAHVSRRAK